MPRLRMSTGKRTLDDLLATPVHYPPSDLKEPLSLVPDIDPQLKQLLDDLGLASYVDYDDMVCRRSQRKAVRRELSLYGKYVGP